MITLKLKQYKTIEFHLAELLKVFNGIKLNDVAAKYVTGQPITDVEPATVLRLYNYDRASTLPNFSEYRAMGIDLSATMPDCSETDQCLQALTDKVSEYSTSQYHKELRFICYDRKAKQFVVNDTGKAALASAVITLTGREEEMYNSVLALHSLTYNINSGHAWKLLSEDIIHPLTKELNIDSLVYYIQRLGKE